MTSPSPITASRERTTELIKILDLIDGHGTRATAIQAPEDAEVRALCERIGYGAVMDSAARQWFLKDKFGAHTVGPCAATVRDIPAALIQHEATVKEEMARIVCPECGGCCPPYERQVSGPNAAGNYTHKRKDGGKEVLCAATSIHSAIRYDSRTTPPTL